MKTNKKLHEKFYNDSKACIKKSIKKIKNKYPYVVIYEKYQNVSNEYIFIKDTIEKIINNNDGKNSELIAVLENIKEIMDSACEHQDIKHVDKCPACDFNIDASIYDILNEDADDELLNENNIDEDDDDEYNDEMRVEYDFSKLVRVPNKKTLEEKIKSSEVKNFEDFMNTVDMNNMDDYDEDDVYFE